MTSIFDGIYSYGQVSTNYSGKTTPTTMTSYYNKLGNFADFSVDDYVNISPNANKYTTVQSSLNTLVACTGDKWVLYTGSTNCSGYTTWTSSDTETVGATSADKYCMR